ncbi:MAG: hypothetical protein JSV86_08675 [Gemmatimonadota bacterium]|nr:MAG: hypothetical protein JSV86_08675 [Gemmatimonadota bacterium]
MACGECESGQFGCGCCCASVTNIKGGIHPDSISSTHIDLVLDQVEASLTQTHRTEVLLAEPAHIVGVNASLIAVQRDANVNNQDKQLQEPASGAIGNIVRATTTSVSLYTIPGYSYDDLEKGGFNPPDSQEQSRRYFCTASLSSTLPTYDSHEDMFGYFADGGLFVEFNAPSPDYGIRLVVRYVPRLQFSPAYHDPVEVMQHYWKCSRGNQEFLEGFYAGTSLDITSAESGGTSIPSGGAGSGISWSNIETTPSDASWSTPPI